MKNIKKNCHSFSDERRKKMNLAVVRGKNGAKAVGEVLEISLDLIQPFKNQPRKKFNEERLRALSENIKKHGQKAPISVISIEGGQFELVDGERRYRACKMAGLKTIRAIKCEVKAGRDQYFDSACLNLHREENTEIEKAQAVEEMRRYLKGEGMDDAKVIQEIMVWSGYSDSWVRQHLRLLQLCGQIQRLVEEEKLPFQVATSLCGLKPDCQIRFAEHIIKNGLNFKQALLYIRSGKDRSMMTPGARFRRPSDDFNLLKRFLNRFAQDSESIANLSDDRIKEIFLRKSEGNILKMIESIKCQIEQLGELQLILQEVLEERISQPGEIREKRNKMDMLDEFDEEVPFSGANALGIDRIGG